MTDEPDHDDGRDRRGCRFRRTRSRPTLGVDTRARVVERGGQLLPLEGELAADLFLAPPLSQHGRP